MGMEVTRDNDMLMTYPTSSHLMKFANIKTSSSENFFIPAISILLLSTDSADGGLFPLNVIPFKLYFLHLTPAPIRHFLLVFPPY